MCSAGYQWSAAAPRADARRSAGGARQTGQSGSGAGQDLLFTTHRQEIAVVRRECGVDVGARVAFDTAADAVQIEVEGGELDVRFDDFADTPDIEDERILAGQAGAALA